MRQRAVGDIDVKCPPASFSARIVRLRKMVQNEFSTPAAYYI